MNNQHIKSITTTLESSMSGGIIIIALSIVASATPAQTWQTVDDFQYVAGYNAYNFGLAVTPSGTLFAAGHASSPPGAHGIVMASADSGATWSGPLDDTLCPGCGNWKNDAGLVSDSAGTLYVAGRDNDGLHQWLVRQGSNGGTNWATVDDFAAPGSQNNEARGLGVDGAGNVYVVGRVTYTNSVTSWTCWTVRKGVGGTSFSTVDSFLAGSSGSAQAVFVHPTAGAFVAGRTNYTVTAKNGSSISYSIWTVRRSVDGGGTWATVDSAIYGEPRGIGADASGNIYVVGGSVPPAVSYQAAVADLAPGGGHWIVRKSSDGGNSWTTVDDLLPCVTLSTHPLVTHCALGAAANAFAVDAHGNLFVAGCLVPYGASGSLLPGTHDQWLVRENPGGTGTWTTVDTFQYAPNQFSASAAIAADALGNIFVGGFGVDDCRDCALARAKKLTSRTPALL